MSWLILVPQSVLIGVMCLVRKIGGLTPDKLAPTALGFYVHSEVPRIQALLMKVDPFLLGSIVIFAIGARRLLRLTPFGTALVVMLSVLMHALQVFMAR